MLQMDIAKYIAGTWSLTGEIYLKMESFRVGPDAKFMALQNRYQAKMGPSYGLCQTLGKIQPLITKWKFVWWSLGQFAHQLSLRNVTDVLMTDVESDISKYIAGISIT